jgi:hypothetical protein
VRVPQSFVLRRLFLKQSWRPIPKTHLEPKVYGLQSPPRTEPQFAVRGVPRASYHHHLRAQGARKGNSGERRVERILFWSAEVAFASELEHAALLKRFSKRRILIALYPE